MSNFNSKSQKTKLNLQNLFMSDFFQKGMSDIFNGVPLYNSAYDKMTRSEQNKYEAGRQFAIYAGPQYRYNKNRKNFQHHRRLFLDMVSY